MQVLTAEGTMRQVSERQWPLAGLDHTRNPVRSHDMVRLVGDMNFTTFVKLYKENPWVNAGIRTIAWGLSRSPLQTFELYGDGQRRRVRWDLGTGRGPSSAAQRLDKMLNTAPARQGPQRRLRGTMIDYLIFGNAMWDISQPEGYYRIPWKKVELIEGDRVPILGYRIKGDKDDRFVPPEDVIHFCAGDDPEGPLGLSPLSSLKYTLALHDALQRHLVAFFENAARPAGNLKLPTTANEKSLQFVRDQVSQLYSSPENAGKMMVTTGDFQPITAAHDQSQIIELAKLSREEIAGVLRIPGPVLGFLEHAIKSNVKELREQYIRDVVGSWAPAMEDDIMSQLVTPDPSLKRVFTAFDLDVHLRPDLEALAEITAKTERVLTTNERRRWYNMADLPYPEADTVPSTPGGGYLGIEPPETNTPVQQPQEGDISGPSRVDDRIRKERKPRDADLDGIVNEPKNP